MSKNIFINLAVKDLNKTINFFSKLGFTFNPQFTDDNATCMIIDDNIFCMLIKEEFFRKFTVKEICDTSKFVETLIAITVESKDKVNELVDLAVKSGAVEPLPPQDHGFMFQRCFHDLDGHIWEIFYMDANK